MLKSPAFSTSFLESRMIQKLKSRKSRIKPGLFAFLLAGRIIFGKKTQKSQVSLLRYLTFSLVCGRIWQQGTAAPCAVRVVGRVRASGTQATSRPRRQPRQVLLPLPECVSPDLAKTAWPGDFSCLNWSGYGLVFRAYVASGAILSHPSSTVFYRRHPLQHLERTRLRLLSSEIGCVSLFFPLLDVQNFRPCFCALCRIAFTD